MSLENKRLLELALVALEAERAKIDEEAKAIRKQLGSRSRQPAKSKRKPRSRRRAFRAAQKRAVSARMTKWWQERKKAKKQTSRKARRIVVNR